MSDGNLALKPDGLFQDVPREEWAMAVPEVNDPGNLVVGPICLASRSAGQLILRDTGLGDKPSVAASGVSGAAGEPTRPLEPTGPGA